MKITHQKHCKGRVLLSVSFSPHDKMFLINWDDFHKQCVDCHRTLGISAGLRPKGPPGADQLALWALSSPPVLHPLSSPVPKAQGILQRKQLLKLSQLFSFCPPYLLNTDASSLVISLAAPNPQKKHCSQQGNSPFWGWSVEKRDSRGGA